MKKESPYEYHNNVLGVQGRFLFAGDKRYEAHEDSLCLMTYSGFVKRIDRGQITRIRLQAPGTPMLVSFDSLPLKWQEAIVAIWGKAPKLTQQTLFEKHYVRDMAAFDFYTRFKFDDHTSLDRAKIDEYTINASVLNTIGTVYEMRYKIRKELRGRVNDIWSTIINESNLFKQETGHTLPENERRLREKYNDYKKNGYKRLIHSGYVSGQREDIPIPASATLLKHTYYNDSEAEKEGVDKLDYIGLIGDGNTKAWITEQYISDNINEWENDSNWASLMSSDSETNSDGDIQDVIDNTPSDFNHIVCYGQSLGSGSFSGEVVSIEQKYSNLFRFDSGVRIYDIGNLNGSKHVTINRIGAARYREMIDYKETLSQADIGIQEKKYIKLVPLVKQRPTYSAISGGYKYDKEGNTLAGHADGETPLTGFLTSLNKTIELSENTTIEGVEDFNFIGSCAAYGATNMNALFPLDKGGVPSKNTNMNLFEVLISDVFFTKAYCDKLGKSYSVNSVLYIHETADYLDKGVKFCVRQVLQLFTLINDRVKEITGQSNDIIFVLHQSALNPPQCLVQLDITTNDNPNVYDDTIKLVELGNLTEKEFVETKMPNTDIEEYDKRLCVMGAPVYPYAYAADGVHLSSIGTKMLSEAMGCSFFANQYKLDERYKPLYPISHTYHKFNIDGNDVYELHLKYHTYYSPLVIDKSAMNGTQSSIQAVNRGDVYGFIFSQNGVLKGKTSDDKNIISDVSVKGNILKIRTLVDVSGWELHYAIDHAVGQRVYGNIRDSRGDNNLPHNWSVGFKYQI